MGTLALLAVRRTPPRTLKPVVILVDDDPATLRALRRMLRNEACELLVTTRPQQALRWTREREVRLVLSDQRMPEMLGTELLTRIRDGSPCTVRVLLTGYPDAPEIVDGLQVGIWEVVAKPWEDGEIRRRIRAWLAT